MGRDTAATFSLKFCRTETVAKVPLADTSAAIIGISSAEAAGKWFSAVDGEERSPCRRSDWLPEALSPGALFFSLQGQE